MSNAAADDDRAGPVWLRTWNDRGRVLRDHFGPSTPPDAVDSFPAPPDPDRCVPGACAVTFAPATGRPHWLTVTLGLTQPLDPSDPADPHAGEYELAVYTDGPHPWRLELLRDLVEIIAPDRSALAHGHFLPAGFFHDADGRLDCSASDLRSLVEPASPHVGLYLWPSLLDRALFETSTGDFFLMTPTLVTAAEESLADHTSPPHLILLLRELGLHPLLSPDRPCATIHHGFAREWRRVRALRHDDVLSLLHPS